VTLSVAEVEEPPKNETVAVAEPEVEGAKVSVKGMLWPAGIVVGKLTPPRVNWELLELDDESVTLAPLAVILPVLAWLEPTSTLPKFIEVGVTVSVPVVEGLVPIPESAIAMLGSEAFDTRPRVAVADPAEAGENVTERLALCPASRE